MKIPARRKIRLTFSSKAYNKKNFAASAAIALKKGWGQIGVEPYHPFIPVHQLAGYGFSVRLCCPRTGESIHCHSLGEANWARIHLWTKGHKRLFTQVIIPRQASQRIAKELGIKHPNYPDGTPVVMTTDAVHLCLVDGVQIFTAYSVKLKPHGLKRRKLDLLAIEKRYYEELGIPWSLKFRYDADQTILGNIRFVESFVGASTLIWGSTDWERYEGAIYTGVMSGLPLNEACWSAEKALDMPQNSALTLARFFIANRIWDIDWTVPINPFKPLVVLQRHERGEA
jgi:hypothetical protein